MPADARHALLLLAFGGGLALIVIQLSAFVGGTP